MAAVSDYAVFSDFDGTITTHDTLELIIDTHPTGYDMRMAFEADLLGGQTTFRAGLAKMFEQIEMEWEEAMRVVKAGSKIDPHFPEFAAWCSQRGMPVHVLSSGFRSIIQTMLNDAGVNDIRITSNFATVEGRRWVLSWNDDSGHGHDKAASLKAAKAAGKRVVFMGDGISDVASAAEADILFARKGRTLERIARERGLPFIPFDNFAEVKERLSAIVDGREQPPARPDQMGATAELRADKQIGDKAELSAAAEAGDVAQEVGVLVSVQAN